jgi:ribosomal protein S12 methylthiotransferase accessory factor
MGITRIANVTGLDRLGLPVVTVCRPNARSLAVSQGKGLDLDSAKASGVMESVEAYHAEHIDAALRYGSLRELAGSLPLANVQALPKSGANQLHDELRLFWIEGRNWLDGSSRWLPLETVSVDFTLPLPPGHGSFAASTNGLASGNTLNEAVAHGICEVVERDAVALWKLQGERTRRAAAVDSDTIDEPLCRAALACFERARVQVKVWDVTSDVGIPAFCCLAYGDDDDWADPEFGAGCHPAREVALLRALTEAAQARTTFIAGSRDDLGSALYAPAARHRRRAYCRGLAAAHAAVRAFNDTPTLESDNLRVDVEWMLSRLRAVDIEQVLVVDLTRNEFGLPVVRVVIPGLEGAYGHEQGDFVPGARARALMPFPSITTP